MFDVNQVYAIDKLWIIEKTSQANLTDLYDWDSKVPVNLLGTQKLLPKMIIKWHNIRSGEI